MKPETITKVQNLIESYPPMLGVEQLKDLSAQVTKCLQAEDLNEQIATAYARGDMAEAARLTNENATD